MNSIKKTLPIILLLCLFLFSCEGNTDETTTVSTDETTTVIETTAQGTHEAADTSGTTESVASENLHELVRTGEFITKQQMDELKAENPSWQSVIAGIGGIADVVAIDLADGSGQHVYIGFPSTDYGYERLSIEVPEGTQVRIYSALSGAGSGEIMLSYKFATADSEWIELFYAYGGNLIEDKSSKWENWTDTQSEYIEWLNEIPSAERQFT